MALFSAGALMGTGIGPLLTSFIVSFGDWRWVFWTQGIVTSVTVIYLVSFFPETRASVLLSRKAKALNRLYDKLEAAGLYGVLVPPKPEQDEKHSKVMRVRFKTVDDEDRQSIWKMIRVSCYRPCRMLVTESVVFFFSLWAAFAWAVLYMQFGAIPLVFSRVYGFNKWQCGLVFTTICVGTVVALIVSIYLERVLRKQWPERASSAEGRLVWACFGSLFLPAGLFWFGWTSQPTVPFMIPILGIFLSTMGIFSIYLSCFNFLTDAYHVYASSALAAQSGCRNILGGIFPLVTSQMFTDLGHPWASSVLGLAGFLLCFVPWALMIYGPHIRARSKMFCSPHTCPAASLGSL
ncbi:hypothetical protein KEM52_006144 [Ascosphaera acerosa]|nr:hypothetical protein KEM52_006144 [Ascosphaera acerosa]